MGDSTVKIKPFDGNSDFAMWCVKMKAILIKQKCWKAISTPLPSPPSTSDKGKETEEATTAYENQLELDELAHSEIMLRITDEVARQVVSKTTAKELWDALKDIYEVKSLPNRISLLCQLFTYKMNTAIPLTENLDKFLKLTQELEKCDDQIKETHQAV